MDINYNNSPIVEHFYSPRNVGRVFPIHGLGRAGGEEKGIFVEITINVANEMISDIKFKTCGCVTSVACSSVMTELAKGKSLEECLSFSKETISIALGGIPQEKLYCSELAIQALFNAIHDYFYKSKEVAK